MLGERAEVRDRIACEKAEHVLGALAGEELLAEGVHARDIGRADKRDAERVAGAFESEPVSGRGAHARIGQA